MRVATLPELKSMRDQDWKYEFGRIIASGMIGCTYLVRCRDLTSDYPYYCIKMMRAKPLAEKGLF